GRRSGSSPAKRRARRRRDGYGNSRPPIRCPQGVRCPLGRGHLIGKGHLTPPPRCPQRTRCPFPRGHLIPRRHLTPPPLSTPAPSPISYGAPRLPTATPSRRCAITAAPPANCTPTIGHIGRTASSCTAAARGHGSIVKGGNHDLAMRRLRPANMR